MVSTMLSFRLVSAALCSALLLDENLSNPLQIIGASIVLFRYVFNLKFWGLRKCVTVYVCAV
jgi:hypothetical protein